MGRLGSDAAHAIEAAAHLARRYRHEAVEPEHVLRVLATDSRVVNVFADLAIEGERLAEQLDGHLATWPASGLYRDARVEPATSERFRILLERAGASRVVSLFRPVTIAQLALATCRLPSLAALVLNARAESFTARAAVSHARILASARGDDALEVFHVLHVVADQAWMSTALRTAGIEPATLQRALEKRLERTLAKRAMLAPGFEKIAKRNLWVGPLLRAPSVASLFADDLGIPIHAVLRALVAASGEVVDDEQLPSGDHDARIDIVFYDDEFTTMEFVVDVLSTVFGLSAPEAAARMIAVHEGGKQVVATLPARDARKAIKKARSRARRENMPLRISWQPSMAAELDSSDG
jgi:ATP-dependent Clp protease adaptor protein ClpS